MILMRVYENQENMTMQTVLRDALEKLGLVGDGGVRAFSVLSDISNTVIADAIEPYFLNHHDLRRAIHGDGSRLWGFDSDGEVTELPLDGSKRTLKHTLTAKLSSYAEDSARGMRPPKAELGYEDLHNLPMLLIVTEKARMGDTFPHSLASLDLRMRTGGTLVAFVQELGRMCRYPSTRLLQRGATRDELRNGKFEEVERAFKCDLPLMLVAANKDDREIVCHVLRHRSLPTSELCDDKLFQGFEADAKFDVYGYFDRLPRAVIREDVQQVLVKAIEVKESRAPNSVSALHCINMKDGLDAYMATVKGKTDKLLLDGIDDKKKPLHTYHESYEPKLVAKATKAKAKGKAKGKAPAATVDAADEDGDEGVDDDVNDGEGGLGKTPHYDALPHDPHDKHSRRMLLFAECQIGKTGAYLYYLRRLREVIRGSFEPPFVPGPINCLRSWHFPYWKTLADSGKLDYSQPKEGHYYEKVAKQRLAFLQAAAKALTQTPGRCWISLYCEWLSKAEVELLTDPSTGAKKRLPGELIVSSVGAEKIADLKKSLEAKHANIPISPTGEVKQGSEAANVLKACINWDQRMTNLSVLGDPQQLAELQQPGYDAANVVWDKPAVHVGLPKKAKCLSAHTQQMMARREPPSTVGSAKITHSKLTLLAQKFGNGTELLSNAEYSLYVPSSMSSRVSVKGISANANSDGLDVRRWMFTCSCVAPLSFEDRHCT